MSGPRDNEARLLIDRSTILVRAWPTPRKRLWFSNSSRMVAEVLTGLEFVPDKSTRRLSSMPDWAADEVFPSLSGMNAFFSKPRRFRSNGLKRVEFQPFSRIPAAARDGAYITLACVGANNGEPTHRVTVPPQRSVQVRGRCCFQVHGIRASAAVPSASRTAGKQRRRFLH